MLGCTLRTKLPERESLGLSSKIFTSRPSNTEGLFFAQMIVKSPENTKEWDSYYWLRWEILRKPWNQPIGSERDKLDEHLDSFHAMAVDDFNKVMGVARLHLVTPGNRAQIRFMAVNTQNQAKGIGKLLIQYLENVAKQNNVKEIILQARENAVGFYIKEGYQVIEKSFVLYNQIQHYLMLKTL